MSRKDSTGKYKTIKMRPEDEFLLCCARTNMNPEIKDKLFYLTENNLDWEYLLKLASRHRLMPLLYYNLNSICPELVPEDVLKELEDNFNANVRKNLMFTGELIKVLNLLKSEDITAIPYKGPFLASMAYGNIVLREFSDLDIFIPKSEVLKAKELLISNEFTLILNNLKDSTYLNSQREYKFINEKTKFLLEIQWKLHGVSFSFPINPNLVYTENIEYIKISNLSVSSFSPENLLLILSIHSAGHRWLYIAWICDMAELINRYDINWDTLLNNAENLCIKRILFINLRLTSELLGTKIPKRILDLIYSDKYTTVISKQVQSNLFSEKLEDPNLIKYSILHFRMRENLKNGLKDLILHVIAPSPEELKILKLPNSLFLLYYILRPIFLLKRYV